MFKLVNEYFTFDGQCNLTVQNGGKERKEREGDETNKEKKNESAMPM